ncbi:NAD-dependent epimerase/dehydratase family protein [Trichlorobacter sp.]|uniref:NAD-dependent epimerase/dehydratase family protein n=1 Tax=Trichlorobacter sp. TaxID=2911007 RepID=UPI002A35F7A0|nr:NAD-dependent epimerase/dehydratase family protein [Trichlorobacter sp.]MDY0383103.1 NAD-dependent epimerase/dehydratase family protein [Trichlorobacter sp.]
MNVIVFGGCGFIGSHLVDALRSQGHNVCVFDRNYELFRLPLPDVEYVIGDFGNRGLVSSAVKDIDVVFHLISTTVPKTSNDDPAFDVSSNVIETLCLLDVCVREKVKKVVFVSSGGTVYGIPNTLPINEDHPTNPICSYGISKLAIEKYLFLFRRLHDLDFTVIRPSNPYGPRQNPKNIQGSVSVFLGNILEGHPITIWGDGSVSRDFVYIRDLIDGIVKAAFLKTEHRVFNIGSGVGTTLTNVLELIRVVTKSDPAVIHTGNRSFDVSELVLDTRLAQRELGWAPQTPFLQGLYETWNAMLDHEQYKKVGV